jgi:ribosomal-protein-alanine N-acetyltransferase
VATGPALELTTPRLVLRAWRPSDREPFAALNRDPVVMEHFPAPLSREESDDLIDRNMHALDVRGYCWWAVEIADTSEFIGCTGLTETSFDAHFTPAVEVGWRLAHRAWGHGYATEAGGAAIDHGFDRVGLEEIVSFTTPANRRSRAVMARLGMTHDPADDFDHPRLARGDPLRRHELWRRRFEDPPP